MSYEAGMAAAKMVFETVGELVVVLNYVPRSFQTTPLLYSCLAGATYEDAGTAEAAGYVPHYRTQHRLVLAWSENEQAELVLARLVDDIPAALKADPTLGGAIGDGQMRIVSAEPGWLTNDAGQVTHRICDFYSDMWEV